MSNPIDEYVKRNLADQEIAPSKNLFAEKIQPRIEQRKAAAFPFLRVAAAIVILLAAYAVVKLVINPVDAQYQPQEVSPFAIEETQETQPAIVFPGDEESAKEEDQWVNESIPSNAVAQEETEKPQPKTSPAGEKKLPEQNRTIAMAETNNNELPITAESKPETKKSYKIKIKIDPAKYAVTENTGTEVASATPTVGEYAREQFQHIKNGESLEAPDKEMLPLPRLAVRLEGNPLKKILPGKE